MKRKIKVFVTGADGMLGASICRELIQQGYDVVAMILPNRKSNVLQGLKIQIVEGDILDKEFLEKVMVDCDMVINAAALTNVWPARSTKVMKVNIEGTKNVMEVAEMYKMNRMVHISSAATFNHGSMEDPGNENHLFDGWKFGLDYVNSKYLAQEMLIKKHSKDGFPVIIINPTFMIGPFDSGPSSGKMIIGLYKDKFPGYSTGGKNFVYSADVAVAAVNALSMGRLGECYIAGNENLNYSEFFRKACEIRNKTFKLIKIPNFIILFVGIVNSMKASIIRKPPSLSYKAARMAAIGQYYSSSKAQIELQMPQTPIEHALEHCINWFESNGYLK
jgi:dihydroflavonol-4-reductase